MEKIKTWAKEEFWNGYSLFDKMFMFSMLALQIIMYVIAPDSLTSIISGISGVISVVLCAKGKISFYFIGFVQTISYLFLAFQNQFYGEVAENIFYLITMVIGIFIWKKNMNIDEKDSRQVKALKFKPWMWVASVVGTLISSVVLGYSLTLIGSQQAYTDAATNVFALFGQILMIKRYREQWIWWLLVNLFCLKLWIVAGNWSMVAMYIAWTINCIYGWYNWTKMQKAEIN